MIADIRLQSYTARVKDLIRADRHDEAIAHCQHILKSHPRHIETYCLLGQACLEKEMFREAIECFQRTLSADPENLIARVGLGIIFGEQGSLPEAIWQMERAFELSPGNSEVRRELQRLYAQRDGVEKSRLRLTPGALGRLYIRNGLYERAIAEFRAILRQDPNLPDIQVALAEALWRDGRRLEAVEVCLDLLSALPNCLKANLILGEIWTHGGSEEAGEERLNVARSLDPENVVAQDLFGGESPLPPEEVLLVELEDSRAVPSLGTPWSARPMPSREAEQVGEQEQRAPSASGQEPELLSAEQIPDWIQDLEQEPVSTTPGDADMLESWKVPGEVPDWLRDLAVGEETEPAAARATEAPMEEIPMVEEIPEWLRDLGPVEPSQEAPVVEEIPEWLREPSASAAEVTAAAPLEEGPGEQELAVPEADGMFEGSTPVEQVPAWLQELGIAQTEEPIFPETEAMDEESLAAEGTAQRSPEPGERPAMAAEPPAPGEPEESLGEVAPGEIPDWLRDLGVLVAQDAALPQGAEETTPPAGEALTEEEGAQEEVPAWLSGLGTPTVEEPASVEAEGPAAAAPMTETPESLRALVEAGLLDEADVAAAMAEMTPEALEAQRAEAIPDWLKSLVGEETPGISTEEPVAPPVTLAEEPEVPDWLQALGRPAAEEATPAPGTEEAPQPSEILSEPLVPAGEVPDWLKELGVATAGQVLLPAEASAAEPEPAKESPESPHDLALPDVAEPPASQPPEEIAQPVEAGAEETPPTMKVPDWLRELESGPGEQATSAEEIPDWLRDLELPAAAKAAAPAAQEAAAFAETPDWLLELKAPIRGEPSEPAAGIPDWLQELGVPGGEPAVPPAVEDAALAEELTPEAEVPDWLRELRVPAAEQLTPPAAGEEIPEWLQEIEGEPAGDEGAGLEAPVPLAERVPPDQIPVWLRGLVMPAAEEAAPPSAPEEAILPEIQAAAEAVTEPLEVPDWLREVTTPIQQEPRPVEEEWPVLQTPDVEEPAPVSTVPPSLRALVEAGMLDEADVAEAMARMTPEELEIQRAEAVPDWLTALIQGEETVQPGAGKAGGPEAVTVEEAPVRPHKVEIPEVEEPPVPLAVEEPETMEHPAAPEAVAAWLRDLGVPASEEVPPAPAVEPPAEESMPAGELPAWLRDPGVSAIEETPVVPETEIPTAAAMPAEAVPDRLLDLPGPAPEETPPPVAEEEAPAEGVPAWLHELGIPTREESPVLPAAEEEMPPLKVEAPREEAAPAEEVEALIEEAAHPPEAPDWLRELEMRPAPEDAELALEMTAPREEIEAPVAEVPSTEELLAAEQPPAEVVLEEGAPKASSDVAAAPALEPEPVEPTPRAQVDELLAQLKARPRDHKIQLELARLYGEEGNWQAAFNQYERLVSARKLTPAVVSDLEALLQANVDQVRLYQLLGDAYMQQDRLDEALAMYRQARQVLTRR